MGALITVVIVVSVVKGQMSNSGVCVRVVKPRAHLRVNNRNATGDREVQVRTRLRACDPSVVRCFIWENVAATGS